MHLAMLGTIAASILAFAAIPAKAAGLIRDADIEHSLMQLAKPVLQAAGLSPARMRILLIDDRKLNAFVVDTQSIFLHTGLVLKLQSAEALQAVIAHEAAHIANGHIVRRSVHAQTRKGVTGLGVALAAAAALSSGRGETAGALAVGVASSARRSFLAHSRAEESAADQSSIRYLAAAGIGTQGAVDVHKIFEGQDALADARQDPYARSHPFTRDRVRAMKAYVSSYGGAKTSNPTYAYWFARAKGKLAGFKRSPKTTLTRAKQAKSAELAHLLRAIAHHKRSQVGPAAQEMRKLLALRSNDPYYYDLLGQIYLENRQFAKAKQAYQTAAKLAPRNALILGGYGRALLVNGAAKAAIVPLEKARSRDNGDPSVLRDLGVAYAKIGKPAMASLATAERYALNGRFKDAELHAKRAAGRLPRGSGPWQRAQDVLSAAQRIQKRR